MLEAPLLTSHERPTFCGGTCTLHPVFLRVLFTVDTLVM